jgi:hypothetical protein
MIAVRYILLHLSFSSYFLIFFKHSDLAVPQMRPLFNLRELSLELYRLVARVPYYDSKVSTPP